MMRAVTLAAAAAVAQADHYAVLVAGSNSWSNYRHQADVCHAYQVVKSKGISEDNIIVMAYDDLAQNSRNPFPGKLFNKPDPNGPGVDVYSGCKIDYSGKDVTPANFQKVLTGTASGKSLQSGPNDNVFIFFSDHGATGLIAFPGGASLHTKDLQSTFDTMHSKNMYSKLVMYLETCESGSMFQGMTTPGVYALSASSPDESSWGWYCSSSSGGASTVNGKSIGSCLGDLFSIAWMEDSDLTDITAETLDAQFSAVKSRTSKSKVMQWGDLSFKTDKVAEYQGNVGVEKPNGGVEYQGTGWSAREIDLAQAYQNYIEAAPGAERIARGQELEAVITDQLKVEAAYQRFLEILYPDAEQREAIANKNAAPEQRDCEMATRQAFMDNGDFSHDTGFAYGFHKYIVNACADVVESGSNVDLVEAAKQACSDSVVV